MENKLRDSVFLKACRREKTPYTPVWLMRQAGRYMRHYRDVRAKMSFNDLCKNPAMAAEVTVMAQEKFNTDAAIIFSDILLLLEPMGFAVNYLKKGPSISPALSGFSVDHIREAKPEKSLSYVCEAVRLARKELKEDIPLIGFAGAPFTLASYMIEGGASKEFSATKKFMQADSSRWGVLMNKITHVVLAHLNAQIKAGVQAVQVFDSWAGILTPREYEKFVLPYSRKLIAGINDAPVIHFGTRTGPFLKIMSQAGGDVIGVDYHLTLDAAWDKIGSDKGVQGNLDPLVLLSDHRDIKNHVIRILKEAAGRPGHIFNLGHGVLPETPEDNVKFLVETVHELSQR